VHPDLPIGSRERYLYFTLAPSLNFQRQSPALWASALKTWEDKETNYLFFPEKVVKTNLEKVRDDLKKHKLSLQPNKHTSIWVTLCKTLHQNFQNDPRILLSLFKNDVEKVILHLQENKKDFPYLNGSKMSNYWLYILISYTDIKLKNRNKISIIPDTHIQQTSIHLCLSTLKDSPDLVAKKWFDLLKDTEINPVQLHPIFWNWSRNNFKPKITK
jgi:hypothetical protein